ncbi:DUF3784 domain-containing protein [Belliella kenyensis]|uniref:DUF3784 domain-containing protein n=1 Tax=Belliella kenyensis TaxID=1472724 RepID=A0ABV8EP16_9BACT|nr:DUF3784 domain-containing protein [Belliella kenyensis]MCH7403790.1 DUF3784 domain-containing protein [Belliella kenyensis]MDN3602426.1 DUF3784 domain-containing protein [Belliella kenyensis]
MMALITGIILISLGLLVKTFPNLITGYNTMTQKEKEKVDIGRFSSFMRNAFIIMGLTVALGHNLLLWFGLDSVASYFVQAVIIGGVLVISFVFKRYDHNNYGFMKDRLKRFLAIAVLLVVSGSIAYAFIPTKIKVAGEMLEITGAYSVILNQDDLESVQLVNTRPKIKGRTNGISLGPLRKGFFNVHDNGRTRLYIHSNKGPFLYLNVTEKEDVIINYKDQKETERVYLLLKNLINQRES